MDLNTFVDKKENPDFNQGINLGSVDSVKKVEAKRNLEILLGDKNIDPERAEEIRKQIQAIDNGEVNPVSEAILHSEPNKAQPGLSHEVLTGALGGDIDLVKVSELGAGYEAMENLITEAKKRAQANKS
jgi:hypothetical protein